VKLSSVIVQNCCFLSRLKLEVAQLDGILTGLTFSCVAHVCMCNCFFEKSGVAKLSISFICKVC